MELQSISQVSRQYGISVRMLRYYEEEGLIESKRKEDYAYRVYDETAIKRLQLIITLRKLQIPVRQIKAILDNQDALVTVGIFRQSIGELDDEIMALSTIRSILKHLVDGLQENAKVRIQQHILSDASMLPLIESLSFTKHKVRESLSMDDLNKANATLTKLADNREQERIRHPQERIVDTLTCNGITVDIVEWSDTCWCGKIGYAADNTGEPDVDHIMSAYQALHFPALADDRLETNWDVCLSINYRSKERPNGVMFGSLVKADRQHGGFDLYKVPAATFARIRMCDETARALGHEPWKGGIPPHEWIGEEIASKIGYRYGNDTLPIVEYYGYYDPEKYAHEFCYLYVPVEKI